MPKPRPSLNSTQRVLVQYIQADPATDYRTISPGRYIVTVSREDGDPMMTWETYWALRESVGIMGFVLKTEAPQAQRLQLARVEQNACSLKAAKEDEEFQLIMAKLTTS